MFPRVACNVASYSHDTVVGYANTGCVYAGFPPQFIENGLLGALVCHCGLVLLAFPNPPLG